MGVGGGETGLPESYQHKGSRSPWGDMFQIPKSGLEVVDQTRGELLNPTQCLSLSRSLVPLVGHSKAFWKGCYTKNTKKSYVSVAFMPTAPTRKGDGHLRRCRPPPRVRCPPEPGGATEALGRCRWHDCSQPSSRSGDWQKCRTAKNTLQGCSERFWRKLRCAGLCRGVAGESEQDGRLDVPFEIWVCFFYS